MFNFLKPKRELDSVDKYLICGINGLEAVNANPRVFVRVFNRGNGLVVGGVKEFLSALLYANRQFSIDDFVVWSLPEGTVTNGARSTIMTIEGPAEMIMPNETMLNYLNVGTQAFTVCHRLAGKPVIDMAARDRTEEQQAQFARPARIYGIPTTVLKYSPDARGTMSHSQISAAMAYRLSDEIEALISAEVANLPAEGREKVAATIRATIAFALGNPSAGVIVLADYAARSVGCAPTAIATYNVCKKLGIKVIGCRLDISKSDLDDEPIIDKLLEEDYRAALKRTEDLVSCSSPDPEDASLADYMLKNVKLGYQGVCLRAITKTREALDAAGLKDFIIVVSGNMKIEKIDDYIEAGANIVGIGEAIASYKLGECSHTSDSCGYFDEGKKFTPAAKEGRELWRIVDQTVLDNFKSGDKMFPDLERVDLAELV